MTATAGPTTATLDAALDHAAAARPVVVLHGVRGGACRCGAADCHSPGKHPLPGHGLNDATTDIDRIRRAFEQNPNANYGVATGPASRLVVVDVDLPEGNASLAALEQEIGPFPETSVVRTASGGRHIYFEYAGDDVRNSAGKLGADLDVRGAGGYVVGAGSVGVGGLAYETVVDAAPAPLPEALRQRMLDSFRRPAPAASPVDIAGRRGTSTKYGLGALRSAADALRSAPEGSRNDTLNAESFGIGRLVAGREIDEALARTELVAAGISSGLTETEVRATVASGLSSGMKQPRTAPPREKSAQTATSAAVPPSEGVGPTPEESATDDPEPDGGLKSVQMSDLANAERLVRRHGRDLRYVAARKTWLAYDEKAGIWRRDDAEAHRRAHESARWFGARAMSGAGGDALRQEYLKHAMKLESRPRLEAAVAIAARLPGVAIEPDELDANVGRLVVGNGVVDLRTGALHPFRREEFATRHTPVKYVPESKCPRFMKFLDEVFLDGRKLPDSEEPDRDLIEYVLRGIGYSLTGLTTQHVVFVDHGDGENGKSVFNTTLRRVAGTYAGTAEFGTFAAGSNEPGRARSDIACLPGLRVVTVNEGDEGVRLDEALIKSLSGGDEKQARELYEKVFTFTPRFRVWISCNQKPKVRGRDRGIWRRLKLIPFLAVFRGEKCDKELPAALALEDEGVLALFVRFAMRWHEGGLGTCAAVEAATAEYKAEQDVVAAFVADRCVVAEGLVARGGHLYGAFTSWSAANNEEAISGRDFAAALRAMGFEQLPRDNRGARWGGLTLLDAEGCEEVGAGRE